MKVAIYAEDKFRPQVQDIMQEVFDEHPQITDAVLWTPTTPDTVPTIVLGHLPVGALPVRFVKTLSQKQILSNPAAVTELRVAVKNLLSPPSFPKMQYTLIEARDSATRYFTQYKKSGAVVVDIETGGDFKIMLPEETWLLSVAIFDGKTIIVLTEEWLRRPANREELLRFLQSGVKLIAHNMKFDFRTLTAQLGGEVKGHLCTLLLHHSVNPGAKEHDLKKTCQKYLGAPDWDSGIKEYVKGNYKELPDSYPAKLKRAYADHKVRVGYENIPKAMLYEYNAYDVYWDWYLLEFLTKAVNGDENRMKIAKFEFEMSNFFQDVEKGGVAVDLDYLAELKADFTAQEAANLAELWDYTGNPKLNPNAPQQVKKQYEEYGHYLKSTAEEKLEDLVATLDEDDEALHFTTLLLQARKITKMKGTYVDGILKRTHNGIVYPDFLVHGTSTGRLSSRDPNIQNIPRDEDGKVSLRRIFVPRDVETRSLISVDYSQAELRVMACLSGDEYLISLFQPGMPDFFDSLMPTAFPKHDLAVLDKDTKKNMRANLKGVIYGMSYGRRAAAIAKALGMSVKDAQSIITNYFKAAPALYDWRADIEAKAVSPEATLVSPFGRYYQAEVVTGRNKQSVINSGLAFLPQSTASDICVTAAIEVNKWLWKYDAFIVATIHDAILIDAPDQHIAEIEARVQDEMIKAGDKVFHGVVPFATEATHGKSWKGI